MGYIPRTWDLRSLQLMLDALRGYPVHPITAGSAKLPDWLIRETEETLENNIRSP